MRPVIVTDPPRTSLPTVEALGDLGVATVHEALGRGGLLHHCLRPIQSGVRTAGSAVTALCGPGDNLMLHAAIEHCRPGDILVVATTSPAVAGVCGELIATALQYRGVRGMVTDAGVRDVAELREMGFPVWARGVSAQGTTKVHPGSVNLPVQVGGITVAPGDVIVADDDGVVCVPRSVASHTVQEARARVAREREARAAFEAGQLTLDYYNLREVLAGLAVEYVPAQEPVQGRARESAQERAQAGAQEPA